MLEHHLQRAIVYRLAFEEGLRFSELKPDTIENKLFTYHLKKVLDAGYVSKDEDGVYRLTPDGRRLGVHVLETQNMLPNIADSVLFLVVRRKLDGAWLMYRRNTHPLKGLAGFMHGRPNAQEESTSTAAKICQEKTGLTGQFKALGGGYFRMYEGDNLESFTHFTLLVCEDAVGQLQEHDNTAEYFWEGDPDFSADNILPNMPVLVELYQAGKPFFIEKTFSLDQERTV